MSLSAANRAVLEEAFDEAWSHNFLIVFRSTEEEMFFQYSTGEDGQEVLLDFPLADGNGNTEQHLDELTLLLGELSIAYEIDESDSMKDLQARVSADFDFAELSETIATRLWDDEIELLIETG